jgi:hypothetical protein
MLRETVIAPDARESTTKVAAEKSTPVANIINIVTNIPLLKKQ